MQQRIKNNVQHAAFSQAYSVPSYRWGRVSFGSGDGFLRGSPSYQLLLLILHWHHRPERDASSP